jgi:hypothetical protein
MMFSSKTPRDLNRDPDWFCGRCGGINYEHSILGVAGVEALVSPKRGKK